MIAAKSIISGSQRMLSSLAGAREQEGGHKGLPGKEGLSLGRVLLVTTMSLQGLGGSIPEGVQGGHPRLRVGEGGPALRFQSQEQQAEQGCLADALGAHLPQTDAPVPLAADRHSPERSRARAGSLSRVAPRGQPRRGLILPAPCSLVHTSAVSHWL